VNIEVKPSVIHGLGVFAKRAISKGERIGKYLSRKTDRDGTYVLWVEDERGKWNGYDGYGRLKYVNHQSCPNAEFVGLELYALKDIPPGEEITVDYGDEWAEVA